MGTKYSKFLTVLLIIIVVGIIGILGYLVYNSLRNKGIQQDAAEFVDTYTGTTGTTTPGSSSEQGETSTNSTDADSNKVIDVGDIEGGSGSSKTKKMYKGFETIGTIEIPKTKVSYPILTDISRKSLETSVVAIYPKDTELNIKRNVVIIGHNYRNGLFFSNNKNLSNGDKIYISDYNKKVTYIIYKKFEADENDTSFYNRDTNGAREITLSTCTDDSKARTIIFAKAEGD